jgi:hypothetical protein
LWPHVQVQDGRRNPKQMKDSSKLDSELKKLKGMAVDRGGRNIDLSRFDGAFSEPAGGGGGGVLADATPSRKKPRIHGV